MLRDCVFVYVRKDHVASFFGLIMIYGVEFVDEVVKFGMVVNESKAKEHPGRSGAGSLGRAI